MKEQTILTSDSAFSVNVSIYLFQEDGYYVAYCPALELSSYGKDEPDARKAFDEAMSIFLKETSRKGTLEKYLLKLGWMLQQTPDFIYKQPIFSSEKAKKLLQSKNSNIYDERIAMPV